MNKIIFILAEKLLTLLLPLIAGALKKEWDTYWRRKEAVKALQKAYNEKDTSYIESIINSL